MRWSEPQFGRKAVRRAGETLIGEGNDLFAASRAFEVLSNWRAAHAYPIQAVLMLLRGKAASVDSNALIVQRLKRTPSILAKLRRESGMKLERMEDIGGCRAVVATTKQVRQLATLLVDSKTRHTLSRTRDYIKHPKASGYRGIHLVYRYNARKKEFKGIPIEIQIRSKIQHSWATAVEVAGAFTRHALKASQGPDDWLKYFQYASVELAKFEGCPIGGAFEGVDTAVELERLSEKLDVSHKLRAFVVTTMNLGKKTHDKSDYFLLVLDMNQATVRITRYGVEQLEDATREYSTLEKQFRQDSFRDVVLVSASSINALKKGYPNYFADTASFLSNLNNARRANSSSKRTRGGTPRRLTQALECHDRRPKN